MKLKMCALHGNRCVFAFCSIAFSWLKWLFRRQKLYITSVLHKFGCWCQNKFTAETGALRIQVFDCAAPKKIEEKFFFRNFILNRNTTVKSLWTVRNGISILCTQPTQNIFVNKKHKRPKSICLHCNQGAKFDKHRLELGVAFKCKTKIFTYQMYCFDLSDLKCSTDWMCC